MTEHDRGDARPHREGIDGYWPGTALIGIGMVVVGLVFLAGNFGLGIPVPDRWWALFIYIPAAASLVSAARFFHLDGRMTDRVAGSATVGLLLLTVASILFFDLHWGTWWPLMVIIVGLGLVARGVLRPRS